MDLYRKTLRFIAQEGLSQGDLLPPQLELKKRLGTCQATLQHAMDMLVEDGVLERRRKAGTVVLETYPTHPKRPIWRVGIVMPAVEQSLFFPLLTQRLHVHLVRQGALNRTYFVSPFAIPGAEVTARELGDFTGLAEDVEAELLDGIITPTRLRTDALPVSKVGSIWHAGSTGVFFDEVHLLEESVRSLLESGARRICCLLPSELGDRVPGLTESLARMTSLCSAAGSVLTTSVCGSSEEALRHTALQLASGSTRTRPDGLVLLNDLTALHLCETLSTTTYQPRIVTPTNRQLPLSFALPVVKMTFDIDEMAELSVQLLMERLRNPSLPSEVILARHQLRMPSPSPEQPASSLLQS